MLLTRFRQYTEAAHYYQIKSNLFAISSLHNITIHEFPLRLAGHTDDNFALMSAHYYYYYLERQI